MCAAHSAWRSGSIRSSQPRATCSRQAEIEPACSTGTGRVLVGHAGQVPDQPRRPGGLFALEAPDAVGAVGAPQLAAGSAAAVQGAPVPLAGDRAHLPRRAAAAGRGWQRGSSRSDSLSTIYNAGGSPAIPGPGPCPTPPRRRAGYATRGSDRGPPSRPLPSATSRPSGPRSGRRSIFWPWRIVARTVSCRRVGQDAGTGRVTDGPRLSRPGRRGCGRSCPALRR